MRRGAEAAFEAILREKLRDFVVMHIENMLDPGFPDLLIKQKGATKLTNHVELKARYEWPTRSTTPVFGTKGLRTTQERWFQQWYKNGCIAYIAVYVCNELFVFDGRFYADFNSFTRLDFEFFAMARTWEEFTGILKCDSSNT